MYLLVAIFECVGTCQHIEDKKSNNLLQKLVYYRKLQVCTVYTRKVDENAGYSE